MNYEEFIDRQEIKIGETRFALSKIPAVQAKALYGEIVRATTDVGDIGMTFLPVEISKRLLAYAAFFDETTWFTLDEEFRINKACPSLENLIELEAAMIRKNFGFLFDGRLQRILAELREGREDI